MSLELDKELKEFIEDYIDSFLAWDLIAFFARNPGTQDTSANLAQHLGRNEKELEAVLAMLAKKGILCRANRREEPVYSYSPDPQLKKRIDNFVQALDSRINRMMVLTEFLQKKGGG